MRKKTALPVRGSAAGSVFFGNRVQAGSGDAVGRFGKSGAGGPNGFLPRISFRRGVGADLRRRAAQGVHEKAAGRLAREGVKASFFLVGENIRVMKNWCARWLKMVVSSGFTAWRMWIWHASRLEKSVEEIRETADRIEAVTGKRPEYIRPPYGSWSTELQEKVSMTPVFWDVDTLDWKNRNTARIVKHICKNAAVHTVVLMHDAYQTSVDAALETIDTLTAEGYTFVTIEECLID